MDHQTRLTISNSPSLNCKGCLSISNAPSLNCKGSLSIYNIHFSNSNVRLSIYNVCLFISNVRLFISFFLKIVYWMVFNEIPFVIISRLPQSSLRLRSIHTAYTPCGLFHGRYHQFVFSVVLLLLVLQGSILPILLPEPV